MERSGMRKIGFLIAMSWLAGCAALQQGNAEREESRLMKAGFRELRADTPQRKEMLAAMTPYEVEQVKEGGSIYYRYADPASERLYVGGAAEYEVYQRLTVRQRAQRASNLSDMTATNSRLLGPMVW